LYPAGRVHKWLKFFRINHRDDQINEQGDGNKADNDVFHKFLKFFAPAGVKLAHDKNQGHDSDVNQVVHSFVLTFQNLGAITGRRLIKNRGQDVKKVLRASFQTGS
jgi:hypothetical protein